MKGMTGMRAMRAMRPMGTMGTMRTRGGLKPIQSLETLPTEFDVAKTDDEKRQGWVERVGEVRAAEAWDVYSHPASAPDGGKSTTLPELLAEAFLRKRGVSYVAQFNLGWARPDFVVFGLPVAPAGALVLEVQGDYWHSRPGASSRDANRKAQLLTTTARGLPIVQVIEVWEGRIYDGEGVLEMALAAQEMGQ